MNVSTPPAHITHEGAPARRIDAEAQLRRSVMACLLWEDTFYEDGESIAARIATGTHLVKPHKAINIALEAREIHHIRHAPLLIARELLRHKDTAYIVEVGQFISRLIKRPDEMGKLLTLYWMDGKTPVSAQLKKGISGAFTKFDEYQLAKWNRKANVTLKDVLRICHPKPVDAIQSALWKRVITNELKTPDTWEVALSTGKDKKETWERLLTEKKLGYMALLMNLRNMHKVGVDSNLVHKALLQSAAYSKALPFRFISAARACPAWEPFIDEAMQASLDNFEKLSGKTIVAIDCSGSMSRTLSSRSSITRQDAAAAIAILALHISDEAELWAFGTDAIQLAPRKGMALVDQLYVSSEQTGHATNMDRVVHAVRNNNYDRMIIISDMQSWTSIPGPVGKGYTINVAAYENSVGYGEWTEISGFSAATVQYIQEIEKGAWRGKESF